LSFAAATNPGPAWLGKPTLQTKNYCSSPLHSSVRGDYKSPRIL
jgi:hypothetical protein